MDSGCFSADGEHNATLSQMMEAWREVLCDVREFFGHVCKLEQELSSKTLEAEEQSKKQKNLDELRQKLTVVQDCLEKINASVELLIKFSDGAPALPQP